MELSPKFAFGVALATYLTFPTAALAQAANVAVEGGAAGGGVGLLWLLAAAAAALVLGLMLGRRPSDSAGAAETLGSAATVIADYKARLERLRREEAEARDEATQYRRLVNFVQSEAVDLDPSFDGREVDLRFIGDFLIALRKRSYEQGKEDLRSPIADALEALRDAYDGDDVDALRKAARLIRDYFEEEE